MYRPMNPLVTLPHSQSQPLTAPHPTEAPAPAGAQWTQNGTFGCLARLLWPEAKQFGISVSTLKTMYTEAEAFNITDVDAGHPTGLLYK
eukprot:jgi/Tetstr1/442761/TSEL_030848.t1